jgi:hypothetical protein
MQSIIITQINFCEARGDNKTEHTKAGSTVLAASLEGCDDKGGETTAARLGGLGISLAFP